MMKWPHKLPKPGFMKSIQQLQILFDLPLTLEGIYPFRGAIASFAGLENDLFHNHKGDKLHYRYPLIQYRVKEGRASIFALAQGVAAAHQIIQQNGQEFHLRGRQQELRIVNHEEKEFTLRMEGHQLHYHISNWIPFNTNNFQRWTAATTLAQKVELLNRILVGHLLGFATGMNWQLPFRLEAELTDWSNTNEHRIHGTKHMTLDISFQANISLPSGIGLGKAISQGFGVTSVIER